MKLGKGCRSLGLGHWVWGDGVVGDQLHQESPPLAQTQPLSGLLIAVVLLALLPEATALIPVPPDPLRLLPFALDDLLDFREKPLLLLAEPIQPEQFGADPLGNPVALPGELFLA
jgi:hypothetical protein